MKDDDFPELPDLPDGTAPSLVRAHETLELARRCAVICLCLRCISDALVRVRCAQKPPLFQVASNGDRGKTDSGQEDARARPKFLQIRDCAHVRAIPLARVSF